MVTTISTVVDFTLAEGIAERLDGNHNFYCVDNAAITASPFCLDGNHNFYCCRSAGNLPT